MSTNGRRKSKIFELFKDIEKYDLKDQDGTVLESVLFRALDWDENNFLVKRMDRARIRIKAEMVENQEYELLQDAVGRMTIPDVIRTILSMERPLADESADLAPSEPPKDEEEADKKEKSAVQKWEEARQKQLDGMEEAELRELCCRRQETLFIQARAAQEFMNENLCLMVLDPETKEPLFSMEREHENFIGHIMPETREKLLRGRAAFLEKRSEKAVRKGAENPAFLPSGESPKPPADIHGEMATTPSTSQPSPSLSTPSGSG